MTDAPSNPQRTKEDCAWICRETIAETMGFIIISAEIAQKYCELGDEAGLHYQLQRMAAHFRFIGATYRDLAGIRNDGVAAESETV